jgi:cystathionine beta-lyase
MKYDFDRVIDRRKTGSMKWDFCESDVLPMWVADMDFESPREVIDAMVSRAEHGIFGYTPTTPSYQDSVVGWMKRRHGWEIKRTWIITTPGVVPALSLAVLAYTQPGDRIIIQSPVYHLFAPIIKNNGRQIMENSLKPVGGRYEMDFEQLEKSFAFGARTRMMILCSPHNPVGRVWERDELMRLAKICADHEVLIVSDEIHSDIIMDGYKHTPIAMLSDQIAHNVITCTSASKTFNLAGLECSNIIIPNKKLFNQFNNITENIWIKGSNIFGLVATEAAYRHGQGWLEQLLVYIKKNYDFLVSFLNEHIPQIRITPLEGTYLVWLDFRGLGLPSSEIKDILQRRARVLLEDGSVFGDGGEGFQRINIACPKEILKDALNRIAEALR